MIIPNYEIIEKIAEGHQAVVYRGYHKRNPERLLVIKILKAVSLAGQRKAQIGQKIEHLRVLNDPLVITPILRRNRPGVSATGWSFLQTFILPA